MLQFIATGDHRLMRKVNKWPAPQWIRVCYRRNARRRRLDLVSDGIVDFAIWRRERFTAIAAAGSAAIVGIGLFVSIKKFSGRKRPCEIEPHVWAHLLPPDRFSFPSGHTITAFAVAITRHVLSAYARSLVLRSQIATSRILLGMHFLSDVLVGAMLGTGLATQQPRCFRVGKS